MTVAVEQREPLRYRYREREVSLAELDAFLSRAVTELAGEDGLGPPFAIFHGRVDETTASRVEVGVPAADGERELPGGPVVTGVARAGSTGTDYEGVHRVYEAIAEHIESHGLEQNGPTREEYLGREQFAEIKVVWPVAAA